MTESSTGACRMKCITGFLSSTSTASRPCTAAIGIWRAEITHYTLARMSFPDVFAQTLRQMSFISPSRLLGSFAHRQVHSDSSSQQVCAVARTSQKGVYQVEEGEADERAPDQQRAHGALPCPPPAPQAPPLPHGRASCGTSPTAAQHIPGRQSAHPCLLVDGHVTQPLST